MTDGVSTAETIILDQPDKITYSSQHEISSQDGGEADSSSQGENKHVTRLKLFGERAERVTKEEYPNIIGEIMDKAQGRFVTIGPVGQLTDKESFGDLDIVCVPEGKIDRVFFEEVYGETLQGYRRNGNIYSVLLQVAGKSVQVDFICAENEMDYKRKAMYYSKGHASSIIGVLSKQLNFKYGTEGFFRRFQDRKGNWHDVLISDDLADGLRILGLDPKNWEEIRTLEDIIDFIASSPYFDSRDYQVGNMVRRDREQAKRIQAQKYIMDRLAEKNQTRALEDGDILFSELFPEIYKLYRKKTDEINVEIGRGEAINGHVVMEVFGLEPGPDVGRVINFLRKEHPGIDMLTDEVINHVNAEVFKKR